jgi:lipid II:glycine glycyltransferase (peptidoglycan interpeptide bridge formation enzyme)
MVAEKKFTPGSDVNDFCEIQRRLAPDQKMRVALGKKGGRVVCGEIASSIGDTVIGLLAATGRDGRKLRASYLLQWDELIWSKQSGKRFVDLGGINPLTNPGGYTFKTGLKGKEVTSLGVYDLCERKLVYNATLGLESVLGWIRMLANKRKQI